MRPPTWRARPHPARATALALGALVLVTAFLAAAFPRAVAAYETRGVRHALGSVPAYQRAVEITVARSDLSGDPAAACAADELTHQDRAIRGRFRAPLRIVADESQRGVRTTKPLQAQDAWLPRPEGSLPASRSTRPPGSAHMPDSPRADCRTPRPPGSTPWRRRSPSPPHGPSACASAAPCICRA